MFRGICFFLSISTIVSAHTLPPEYENWTALQKRDFIWEKRIQPSDYGVLDNTPTQWGTACNVLLSAGPSLLTLWQSFDHPYDEVPTILGFDRRRVLHPISTGMKVFFQGVQAPGQTGLLAANVKVPGLLRLSIGAPLLPGVPFIPGIALKLFVDRGPSVNAHAIQSLAGQGRDMNFFRHPFSTTISAPEGIPLRIASAWFKLFEASPFHLGVSRFSNFNVDGSPVPGAQPNYALRFVPKKELTYTYDYLLERNSTADFRELMEKIGAQRPLYDVYAVLDKGAEILVGEIVSEAQAISSAYGDRKLFFQHERAMPKQISVLQ